MKKIFPLLFLLLLTLAACSNNQKSADDQTLTVYTTVFTLTSFVEQIAGVTVNVESINPQGADMHAYEPTQKDMISYSDGDLFLTTSNELDPVASSIAETIKNDTEIIETAADINAEAFLESHHKHGHEEAHSDEEEHDHGSMDPHIWLSPSLASDMALSVKTALTELSPDNADMYNE